MSNLSNEEKKDFKQASKQASAIEDRLTGERLTGYGMCTNCVHFSYIEYELGHRVNAFCDHHSVDGHYQLSSSYRVTKCSHYNQRGLPSLEAMWMMAYLIEVKENNVVGFRVSEAESHDLYCLAENND